MNESKVLGVTGRSPVTSGSGEGGWTNDDELSLSATRILFQQDSF